MPPKSHKSYGILIHPRWFPEPPPVPSLGFGYFCMPYKSRIMVTHDPFTWYSEPLAEFHIVANKAAQYLRSYRQPDNGAKTTRWQVTETLLLTSFLETIYMTKRATPPRSTTYAGDLTFLDVRLSQAQFDELDSAKVPASQLMAWLTSTILTGLRFSFSYNPEKKTANAMLTDTRFDSPTKGKALSAFSDDAADALKVLMYKHQVVLEGDWTRAEAPSSERRKRG